MEADPNSRLKELLQSLQNNFQLIGSSVYYIYIVGNKQKSFWLSEAEESSSRVAGCIS